MIYGLHRAYKCKKDINYDSWVHRAPNNCIHYYMCEKELNYAYELYTQKSGEHNVEC